MRRSTSSGLYLAARPIRVRGRAPDAAKRSTVRRETPSVLATSLASSNRVRIGQYAASRGTSRKLTGPTVASGQSHLWTQTESSRGRRPRRAGQNRHRRCPSRRTSDRDCARPRQPRVSPPRRRRALGQQRRTLSVDERCIFPEPADGTDAPATGPQVPGGDCPLVGLCRSRALSAPRLLPARRVDDRLLPRPPTSGAPNRPACPVLRRPHRRTRRR